MSTHPTNLNRQMAIKSKVSQYREILMRMGVSKTHAALLPNHIVLTLVDSILCEQRHLSSEAARSCFSTEIPKLFRGVISGTFRDLPYRWMASTRQIANMIREFPTEYPAMHRIQAHIADILEEDLSYRRL